MSISVESGVWEGILHSIERTVNGESFETWFRPIQFAGIDNSSRVIRLRAPNRIVKEWVSLNYTELVDQFLNELSLDGYSIVWLGDDEPGKSLPSQASPCKEKVLIDSIEESELAATVSAYQDTGSTKANGTSRPGSHPKLSFEPSLSSKYTYDSFVVGSCNQ